MLQDEKRKFEFSDITITAKDYLVIQRSESLIVLNNVEDVIELYNPNLELVSQVAYIHGSEASSYQWYQDTWGWNRDVTPGESNQSLKEVLEDGKNVEAQGSVSFYNIAEVKKLNHGEIVRTSGVVTSRPEDFGSGTLYISDLHSHEGIQINYPKKEVPNVDVGDYVEIAGEFGLRYTESRIKISDRSGINVLDSDIFVDSVDIEDKSLLDLEGAYVRILGTVYDVNQGEFVVQNSFQELAVQSSKNIDEDKLGEGNQITVTGILRRNKKGYFLSMQDIQYHEVQLFNDIEKTNTEEEESAVLSGTIEKDTFVNNLLLNIIATLMVLFTSIVLFKKRIVSVSNFQRVYARIKSWYLRVLQQ